VALVALANWHWLYASRLLAFAWATYPGVVIRQWKGWALVFLLVCGPVGIGFAWLLRSIYAMSNKGLPSLSEVSGYTEESPH